MYSCWGTFKAFGRGKKEDVCFAAGTKCEGHWLYIKPACNARIAVRLVAVPQTAAILPNFSESLQHSSGSERCSPACNFGGWGTGQAVQTMPTSVNCQCRPCAYERQYDIMKRLPPACDAPVASRISSCWHVLLQGKLAKASATMWSTCRLARAALFVANVALHEAATRKASAMSTSGARAYNIGFFFPVLLFNLSQCSLCLRRPDKERPTRQVCEGAVKRFRAVGIKKGGAKLAVIKAGGCVGKSAVALAPPKNESRDDGLVPLGWPAGMPQVRAAQPPMRMQARIELVLEAAAGAGEGVQ